MNRVLIAYDGSPAADAAIHDLSRAALPRALDVMVISVADVYLPAGPPVTELAFPEIPPLLVRKAQDKALQEVEAHRALAARACARIHSLFPKWNCTPLAAADSPAWAILKKAAEWKADLVIVGSQSHSLLEQFFLGSVSHKVAAEAPCSVRVGRPGAASDAVRVIVGVDGSIDSKAALYAVASRAWRPGTRFRLVTVVDSRIETAIAWPGFLPDQFVQSNDESGREWIARMMEAASRILFDAGLEVTNDIFDGPPKEVLVREGNQWPADAIFLGARGLQHGRHLTLGTVASAVASHARCSVELVRSVGHVG